jgi:hypothetical protein
VLEFVAVARGWFWPFAADRILMTACRFRGKADIEQFSARINM